MIIISRNHEDPRPYTCAMTLPEDHKGDGIWFVYALKDPRSDQPFYIGKTRRFLKRMRQHVTPNSGTAALRKRKEEVYASGNWIDVEVLARLDDPELAAYLESVYIGGLFAPKNLANVQSFDYRKRRNDPSRVSPRHWREYETMWDDLPCNLASHDAPLSIVGMAARKGSELRKPVADSMTPSDGRGL